MNPVLPARPLPASPRRPVVVFLTVAEVAAQMRVSKMTVYRLIHTDELTAYQVGRSIRIDPADVDAYMVDARVGRQR